MGIFNKKNQKAEKELEKLPLKDLERAMPSADEEEEPENKEEWILGIIDGWKEKHHCCFPIRLHDFYGFHAIFRKFEAINFDNGEEYIGSFGSCGDGRERYLEMVKEELKYRGEDDE